MVRHQRPPRPPLDRSRRANQSKPRRRWWTGASGGQRCTMGKQPMLSPRRFLSREPLRPDIQRLHVARAGDEQVTPSALECEAARASSPRRGTQAVSKLRFFKPEGSASARFVQKSPRKGSTSGARQPARYDPAVQLRRRAVRGKRASRGPRASGGVHGPVRRERERCW